MLMSTPMFCRQDSVYAAEDRVPHGNRFKSYDHVQRYVDSLRDTWWWESSCPEIKKVEIGRARSRTVNVGWYEADKLAGRCEFVSGQPTELTVIHELSHVIASYRWQSRAHDPWFVRVYLELTYLTRGADVYHRLQTSLVEHGVDINGPRFVQPLTTSPVMYRASETIIEEMVL